MKKLIVVAATALASVISLPLLADQAQAERVYQDAKVLRRVAQVAGRDLPREVLRRIANEDVDLLRGKRPDSTYEYAHYEREEAGRASDRFAVRREGDKNATAQIRSSWVYRLLISVPSRRLVVAHNRRVFVDHVELTVTSISGEKSSPTIPVQAWLEPGDERQIDLPDFERDAIAKVFAHVDAAEKGAATIEIALLNARLVDNSDSPYFAAVQTAKQIQRAIDRGDSDAVRRTADTLSSNLESKVPHEALPPLVAAVPPRPEPRSPAPVTKTPELPSTGEQATPSVEVYLDLQAIEDLLTGSEAERREGLDRLHQLVRRLRVESSTK
jgi:hypothetical protein